MQNTPAWRRSLREASFRGVPFYVDARDMETGRRTALHEFPGRDIPYVEDLGRKARTISVEAYVLGPDYMPGRDALLDACEKAGPGRLVVPWTGEVAVVCTGCRLRESRADGGMAAFSLSFAEAGEAATPAGSVSSSRRADFRADNALAVAGRRLDRDLLRDGMPAGVLSDSLMAMRSVADDVASYRSVYGDPSGLAGHVAALSGLSLSGFAALSPSSLLLPLFGDSAGIPASGHGQRSREMLSVAGATPQVTMPAGAGRVRTVQAENRMAIAAYQRQAAVAEAARSAALSAPESRREAAILRADVCDAIDGVLDDSRDDAVHTSFTDLRTATVRALSESGGSAPEVITVRPPVVLPSLVVAHRVEHVAALDAERDLLRRNAVRHPGFLPAEELEVLRRA